MSHNPNISNGIDLPLHEQYPQDEMRYDGIVLSREKMRVAGVTVEIDSEVVSFMFKSSSSHQKALCTVCSVLLEAAFDSRDVDAAIEELIAATNVRVMMKMRRD